MKVNEIMIEVEGKYDLHKLEQMNFQKVNYKNIRILYRFYGALHQYTFIPIDDKHLKITIRPKSQNIELDHIITFSNIDEVVKYWVSVISKRESTHE